jgi:hypothetical protein
VLDDLNRSTYTTREHRQPNGEASMHIARIGDYIEASYVTGPTHNTLWLRLSHQLPEGIAITMLPPRGKVAREALNSQEIQQAIYQGTAHANALLRTNYHLSSFHYLADDSPKYVVYRVLAYHVTLFVHSEHLQIIDNRRNVFEIVTVEEIDTGRWRVAGRAWDDIRKGDIVFSDSDSSVVPVTVEHISTYNHAVSDLGRVHTGELIVHDIRDHHVPPVAFLYR